MLKLTLLACLFGGGFGYDYYSSDYEDYMSSGMEGSRGDQSYYGEEGTENLDDEYDYTYDDTSIQPDHHYNENKTVNIIHQHHGALIALLGSEKSSSVYSNLHNPTYLDLVTVKLIIEQAMKVSEKSSKLTSAERGEISEVVATLNDRMADFLQVDRHQWLMKSLTEQGENIASILPVSEVSKHLSQLSANAKGNAWGCYDGYLVNMWRQMVHTKRDSSHNEDIPDEDDLNEAIVSLVRIKQALQNETLLHGTMRDVDGKSSKNKAKLLIMLSKERNRMFATKALGGTQELEDLVQYIICSPLTLSLVKDVLRKLTAPVNEFGESLPSNELITNPEDISTLIGIQLSLGEITRDATEAEKAMDGQRTILPNIGRDILNSYMDLVDKAVNMDSAEIWAQLPLEDVNKKLHHLLLSNERYVGTVSEVILGRSGKGEKNFTLDKTSVSVTISQLKLDGNETDAEFEYDDTVIRTDNMITLDVADGKDLKVYALRYKSWSHMIRDILEKHLDSTKDNLTSQGHNQYGNHTRQTRSVDTPIETTSSNKSFIGKGGIISLSTRQNGVKRSVPVTYWIGFNHEMFSDHTNASSHFHRCLSCEYLEADTISWETRGCTVAAVDNNGITCKCNHTTNFAAFMMPAEIGYEITDEETMALKIISLAGSFLSVIGLIFSLTVFFLVRHLVRNERLRAHVNLSIALLAVHVTFLLGDVFLQDDTVCAVSTVFSHYFLLASFMWMLIEGIFLYLYVVQVFLRTKIASYSWMYIVGWVVPIVIVAVSAGYGIPHSLYVMPAEKSPKAQEEEEFHCPEGTVKHLFANEVDETPTGKSKYARCWLSTESGMIWSFLAPALLVLAFNAVIMCKTMKICIKSSRNSFRRQSTNKVYVEGGKFAHSGDAPSASSRHSNSCDNLHGQVKRLYDQNKSTPTRPVGTPSPCLLQVTTEEEENSQPAADHNSSGSSFSSTSSNDHVAGTHGDAPRFSRPDHIDSFGVPSRYHSVSGDFPRSCNTRAVVYRNSVGKKSPRVKVKAQSAGNKMARLVHERAGLLRDAKTAVKGAVVLLPILGVPWVCGFLAHVSLVFTFLFVIFNSTQGIAIFVIYCMFNGEVRRAIQRRLAMRKLKNSVDSEIRRTSSTSTARSFLRFGRRRSTVTTST